MKQFLKSAHYNNKTSCALHLMKRALRLSALFLLLNHCCVQPLSVMRRVSRMYSKQLPLTSWQSTRSSRIRFQHFASTSEPSSPASIQTSSIPPQNIAIVGGGLAGLSTAYHLLKNSPSSSITIFDKTLCGQGGASSVAGGLLHPFSPRGKLVYFGKEGLDESNSLVNVSQRFEPDCVLRDKLYRIALTEKNVKDLQQTAALHPEYATWLSSNEIESHCGSLTKCHGGILLSNGCKVIHVPTYLSGLWKAVEEISMSHSRATWSILDENTSDLSSSQSEDSTDFWKHKLADFDAVVFSAGSGLFHDSVLQKDANDFPAELVRGQSMELTLDDCHVEESNFSNQAILCGKYIAPLKGKNQVLIGATHEYKEDPLSQDEVLEDLRARSFDIGQLVWNQGKVNRITSGYRVQSRRGKYGRIPIIGKTVYDDIHHNSWLFTGLSARGLIYHGVYGKILSESILRNDESTILGIMPDALWWKR